MLCRWLNASRLVRKANSLSTVESEVAFPLRMNQRCCVKQVPIDAVSAPLKIAVKSMETADTSDCVRCLS